MEVYDMISRQLCAGWIKQQQKQSAVYAKPGKQQIPVHCPVEFLAKTNITDKRAAKWGFVEQNYEKGENICS